MSQNDPGPTVSKGLIEVAANRTTNLEPALQALIAPGEKGDTESISDAVAETGTIKTGSNGALLYSAGASGQDEVTFLVTDQLGDSVTASETIAIDPGPSIAAAPVKVAHGSTVSLAALGASLVTPGLAGDTETFSAVSAASGTITTGAGGAISYTAPASGTDTLTYTVTDQLGDSVLAHSTIAVDPGPQIVAGGSLAKAKATIDLTSQINASIAAGLAGDTETITAITATAGMVTLAADGTITYTAPASGSAVLTYTVVDQLGDTATGTYTVTVTPASLSGNVLLYASATSGVCVGAGGIGISLLNAAGAVVATTTTNSGGWFGITNLPAGTYRIQYTVPFGEVLYPRINTVNPTTWQSAAFTLTAGQSYYAPILSLIPVGDITGMVLLGGVGEAGVAVDLLNASGFMIATTTTDSTGTFSFDNEAPGTYGISYVAPAGQGLVAGGPANIATGATASYTLTQGQVLTLAPESLSTSAPPPVNPAIAVPSRLTFDDEFNSFVWSANGSVGWMTQYPIWGPSSREVAIAPNYEAEYYSDASVGVNPFSDSNGVLSITATVAAPGSNPDGLPYNSGIITSYRSLSQVYGYFEARVEMPAGQGIWPAFWMLPLSGDGSTELDIFEVIGSTPGKLLFTTHSLVNGVWVVDSQNLNVPIVSAGYHTYGVDWEPDTITLYIDGTPIAAAPTPANFDVPMYMLLNVAVGGVGSWPGPPASSSEFPASLLVDYVRVYASANTIDVAGTAAIKSAAVTGEVLNAAGGGVAGASISLLNAAGAVIATAVTSAAGSFTFTNLAAGNYQIGYVPPAGMLLQNGGPANTTNGISAVFTLLDAQTTTMTTETLVPSTATITGTVLYAGAAGSGDTVNLLNAAGATVASTVTSSTGAYSFSGLLAGTYQVSFALPAGEMPQFGGLADVLTALTAPEQVAPGHTLNIGAETLVAVTPTFVGVVTSGGVGEGGVAVTLLSAAGTPLAATTTTASGEFIFSGLAPGSYEIGYTAPAGSVLQSGGPANIATGITQPVSVAAVQVISLTAEPLLTNPASISAQVLLAGAPPATGTTGEAGVTVALLDATGRVIATALSNASGLVTFNDIGAGSYQVLYTPLAGQVFDPGTAVTASSGETTSFVVAAGQAASAPAATLIPLASLAGQVQFAGAGQAGVAVALLGPSGQVLTTTTTNAAGTYNFTGLAAGTYQVQYTAPTGELVQGASGADTASAVSAAVTLALGQSASLPAAVLVSSQPTSAAIAGSVLAAGVGAAGVTLRLYNASGTAIATTISAAGGAFSFAGLAAGSYSVGYTAPKGLVLQTGGPASATGLTALLSVTAGQTLTLAPEQLLSNPANIQGSVAHFGGATDPVYGTGEAGVAVSLLDGSGNVLATTVTSSQGWYIFRDIGAGTYEIQFTPPVGQTIKPGSSANAATGVTTAFTVGTPAGQTVEAPQGALITTVTPPPPPPQGNISGSVLAAGVGDAGVTVTLYNASGTAIATTTSGASGIFSFTSLAVGSYSVGYTAPKGLVLQTGGPASATGLTALLSVTAGQTLTLAPEQLLSNPANIQGSVAHFGGATDPVYGTGEAGVAVSLLDGAGNVLASTVTNGQGWYIFRDIGAGTYEMLYTPPAGQIIKPGSTASAAGVTAAFTVGTPAGQSVQAPQGELVSGFTMTGSGLSITQGNGSYIVTGTASASTLTLGTGNQSVTLTGGADTVVTGSGNQTISLSGTANSITVGTGVSTIQAGSGEDTVHAAGGRVTISATGGGNLFDAGAGIGFLNADGSAGNVFMLNAGGAALLTTITGFNPAAHDILDLHRTLAGTAVLANLSNVGSFVTAAYSGGNTVLSMTPTGGTTQTFAVLDGVHTTVAALLAAGDFSLT